MPSWVGEQLCDSTMGFISKQTKPQQQPGWKEDSEKFSIVSLLRKVINPEWAVDLALAPRTLLGSG